MDDWNTGYDPYEVLNAHNEALHEHGRVLEDHDLSMAAFKEVINNQARRMENILSIMEVLAAEIYELRSKLDEKSS